MKWITVYTIFCISFTNFVKVEGKVYEIWQPSVIKELLENNTQMFTNFISLKTNEVEEAINNYVDDAQKKTEMLKKEITGFFESKTDEINNTVLEYVERARSTSNQIMSSMNVFKTDTKCFDPEVTLDTVQLIRRNGYPAETHTIQTEDGYLLSLHRIPRGKNNQGNNKKRQPVFLQHGLLASSADWIIPGPEKGLAYVLADAGYDVWMGNVRGNTYSRAHVNISKDDEKFWDFSWHQIGHYDVPASIDYINDLTEANNEIIYIGHSMGTTVLFVMLSTRPEYNQKLRAAFALAPVTYMSDIKSPIRLLAPYSHDIELIAKFLGNGEFLPQNLVLKWLSRFGCEISRFEEKICENTLFVLCGYDEQQFNKSLIPIILSHTPAGTSTRTLVHYGQEIHAKGNFQMFDFGPEENMKKYGSKTPPAYPLDKITLPIGLMSAANDWLSGLSDAKKLYKQLQNPIELYEVPMSEFNHLDFLWGIDAPTLVFEKLMDLMGKFKPENKNSWLFRNDNFEISWVNN